MQFCRVLGGVFGGVAGHLALVVDVLFGGFSRCTLCRSIETSPTIWRTWLHYAGTSMTYFTLQGFQRYSHGVTLEDSLYARSVWIDQAHLYEGLHMAPAFQSISFCFLFDRCPLLGDNVERFLNITENEQRVIPEIRHDWHLNECPENNQYCQEQNRESDENCEANC